MRLLIISFVLALTASAEAQKVTTNSAEAGPVKFEIVPEIGAGVFLQDSQTVSFGGTDAFFLFRLPGLQFPGMNQTVTGVQVEVSDASPGVKGVKYDILSYTRTKIAGPAYTGANVRIAQGSSETGAALDARVMPVVGLRLLTISEHVPFFLEVEFLDNNRPVKASLILTWE